MPSAIVAGRRIGPYPPSLWPNASTTGVQPGHTLSLWGGGQSLDGSTTYQDLLFPIATGGAPWYSVSPGSGFTMRNCRFQHDSTGSGGSLLLNKVDNSLIEYVEMTGISYSSCWTGTLRYCNLWASGDDFIDVSGDRVDRVDNRCLDITINDNYMHDTLAANPSHADGIQTRGVARITIRHNYINLGVWITPAVLNGCIFIENANDGSSDVTIENNYVNGGTYSMQLQTVSGAFNVTSNVWGPDWHFGHYTLDAPAPAQGANFDEFGNALPLNVGGG